MIAVYLAMLETDVDRDKFMKLYESYEKKLFAIALRILENNEKAEDAVQQAWLRIIQQLGTSKLLGMGFGRRICGYDRKKCCNRYSSARKKSRTTPCDMGPSSS